jgi:RNA polymerase sigma-70 factor (ECF subfamily)
MPWAFGNKSEDKKFLRKKRSFWGLNHYSITEGWFKCYQMHNGRCLMKIENHHYFYGRKIIWNEYQAILREERRKYMEQREMIEWLGTKLLGDKSSSFTGVEIVDTFNQLDEKQRKLLQMRYVYGFSVKELATYYNVDPSRISHRLTESRKAFKKLWEGDC